MANDRLAQLQALDPAILTEVVRQDRRSTAFEISTWSVRRLSDKGIINPDGLWLLSGEGRDGGGARPWSVVVKTLQHQEQEPPSSDMWHWQREALLAQSGLADGLPGRVRAPRFYRVDETPDGAWVWMEHVVDDRPGPWTLDDYAFAARQLGYWNGTQLVGRPLPTEPWLARQHWRTWLMQWPNTEQVWTFPLHTKYVTAGTRQRYDRLWEDRELFCRALEALPQVWSHFDTHRRNSLIRRGQDNQDELVLVDWALVGLGPVGGELYALVGISSLLIFEWPPAAVAPLEAVAFEGYLQGLAEAGWRGDPDVVRLGYLAWAAIWLGAGAPGLVAWSCAPEGRSFALQQFGTAEEELYVRWLPMLSFALDCADEARELMRRQGLG